MEPASYTESRQLIDENLHPFAQFAPVGKGPPRMWSEHQWTSFLDSERAIEAAMNYVLENPTKEGYPAQSGDFVTPFAGLDPCQVTYWD